MELKEEVLPKVIFIIFLIVAVSFVYLFGPKITGFYIHDGSSMPNNAGLILGMVFVLILLAFVVTELMVKIKKF